MVAGTIPIKTPAGQAELGSRARRVSQRHRTLLFLVDGKRAVGEVLRLAQQAGVPESCFDDLHALGLIAWSDPAAAPQVTAPPSVFHLDLPLAGPEIGGGPADSVLPPSRTLYPSITSDSTLSEAASPDSWLPSEPVAPASDPAVAEARLVLMRAVRTEAPLAGSLTMLRLRRARTRADLHALLDEVETRITKPHRVLAATLTLRRARLLLETPTDSSVESA